MKAVCLKAPFNVVLEEMPMPKRSSGEALLKIRSASICGSDVSAYAGKGKKAAYPLILGHEIAAEVLECDEDAPVKPGQLVLLDPYLACGHCYPCSLGHTNCCEDLRVLGCGEADGAMREYFCHPANMLLPIPESISLTLAPLAEPLAIALHGLHQAGIGKDSANVEHVAIVGAGPIGMLAAMSAMHFGVKPIMVDILDARLDYARELGVPFTVNSMKEDAVARIREITGGGAKAVLEMSGARPAIRSTLEYASYCANIAMTGWPTGDTELPTSLITLKELTIRGARTATFELAEALELISGGFVDVSKVLSKTVSFEELPEAIQDQYEHPDRYLKISALF